MSTGVAALIIGAVICCGLCICLMCYQMYVNYKRMQLRLARESELKKDREEMLEGQKEIQLLMEQTKAMSLMNQELAK